MWLVRCHHGGREATCGPSRARGRALVADRVDVLLAEYTRTSEVQKLLVDIRFRLLALVPTLTAIGVSVLKEQRDLRLGVGVLGLVVTLGVVMYEIRNSQIHDAAVHRIKNLSVWLDLPAGGLRPAPFRLLGVAMVWHDRALGIIHGACMGAWAALVAYSLPGWPREREWLLAGVAVAVAAVVYEEIIRINKASQKSLVDVLPPSGQGDQDVGDRTAH